ncbi:hypothetical protein BSFA1_80930 (plasmid) [Burkholderia sp. SFA1]|nr:hypothetical protein BYI23_E001870 [Burkholderia sp. YI23]BBQ02965.1 hypothetical protein BSFA1_80930 [Burkholderia sp. SFA1]
MFGLDEQIDAEFPRRPHLHGEVGRNSGTLPASAIDWIAAMDGLRAANAWTDADLGRAIGLGPSMINQCRSGRRPLPPAARIRLLSRLGFRITRARLLSVVPDEIRDAVLEGDSQSSFVQATLVDQFFDQIDEPSDGAFQAGPFLKGLADFRHESIHALGSTIGLSPADLERVCSGHARLPFRSKAAIIEQFSGFELGAVILSLPGEP